MSNTAILIKLLLNKYDNTHMFAQFYLNKIIDVLNTIGTSNELELPINQNEHKELVLNTLRSINTKDGLYQKYIDYRDNIVHT